MVAQELPQPNRDHTAGHAKHEKKDTRQQLGFAEGTGETQHTYTKRGIHLGPGKISITINPQTHQANLSKRCSRPKSSFRAVSAQLLKSGSAVRWLQRSPEVLGSETVKRIKLSHIHLMLFFVSLSTHRISQQNKKYKSLSRDPTH